MSEFIEYEKLILSELQRHSRELKSINERLGHIDVSIGNLKTANKIHSSTFGLVAGVAGAFMMEAIKKALIR